MCIFREQFKLEYFYVAESAAVIHCKSVNTDTSNLNCISTGFLFEIIMIVYIIIYNKITTRRLS